MRNKIPELCTISKLYNCTALCITESHLTTDIYDAEILIPNFVIFRGDRRDGREKGGSIIYVNNNYACTRIDSFDVNDSLAVLIDLPNYKLIIACVYRSQSISYNDNMQIINAITSLCDSMSADTQFMLVGDFNLPSVSWDTGSVNCPLDTKNKNFVLQKKFVNMFQENGLYWHIPDGTVTRRRLYNGELQESHLDQVFTSDPAIFSGFEIVSSAGKSDHVGILNSIKGGNSPGYIRTEKTCWSKVSMGAIKEIACKLDWELDEMENKTVEDIWKKISENFQEITLCVPTTTTKITQRGSLLTKDPWETNRLRKRRKNKDKAWKDFEAVPTNDNLSYALFKNTEFDEETKKCMMKYEHKMASCMKSNPKSFYAYVNSKRKIKQSVISVKNKTGHIAKSPKETADLLAEFFESTFKEDTYGPLPEEAYIKKSYCEQSVVKEVTYDETQKLLSSVNIYKSTGPDGTHPKILKSLAEFPKFVKNIQILFNTCIKKREIPHIWKEARVTPIHKKGSKTETNNYRPISLTSVICKLYEKVIRERILTQIGESVCTNQHGFVTSKSCLSNLLEATDCINEKLSEGEDVDVFYLDLQKAFDSVSHNRLLVKLQNMGLSSNLLDIVKDFLHERNFYVCVGESKSATFKVKSGVPQGSVLGPLLFVLYINDMPENIKNLLLLFADDAKLIAKASTPILNQEDLTRLSEWQSLWRLTFNTNDQKCKVMHIGKNNPCHKYLLNENELPQTLSEKDLGVTITNNFTWTTHIDISIKKAHSVMAWIMRVIIAKKPQIMLQLYKTLVRPHLEYCVQLWNPRPRHGNWGIINKIEDVQRQFTRQIDGFGELTYRERLSQLNLTTLIERRARGDLIETFKILSGIANYGREMFRVSRARNNILYPTGKLSSHQQDFFNTRVIQYWNILPTYVKTADTVQSFKIRLESYKISCKKKYLNSCNNNYWELSEMILNKIDDSNRNEHIAFLRENPHIALYKKTNI